MVFSCFLVIGSWVFRSVSAPLFLVVSFVGCVSVCLFLCLAKKKKQTKKQPTNKQTNNNKKQQKTKKPNNNNNKQTKNKTGTLAVTLPGAWRLWSALGPVCPVSVDYDSLRKRVQRVNVISVWQHDCTIVSAEAPLRDMLVGRLSNQETTYVCKQRVASAGLV